MRTKYKDLNCEERKLIQLSLERGCTMNAIALSLDRSVSSFSRELARNGDGVTQNLSLLKPVVPLLQEDTVRQLPVS